jgi:GT2 family glycosyltransferase
MSLTACTSIVMNDMPDPIVSIIVVTCGIKDYASACLESIAAQTYPALETTVIDNSRDPAFARRLRERYPAVKLYSGTENLYYGVSLNKGIEMSRGAYVLCLNDDIVLDRDFIRLALRGFAAGDAIGAVSGKILRAGAKVLDSTGLFLSVWRTARERGYGAPDRGQFDREGYIFGVSGAAALYKKEMLDDIREGAAYFDPSYGMFYEDLDVSWRARRRGWKAYYVPGARAFHVRGGSFRPDTGLGRAFARRYLNDELLCGLIRNRYRTMRKNESAAGFIAHAIPVLAYDLCAWLHVLIFRPKAAEIFFSRAKKNVCVTPESRI